MTKYRIEVTEVLSRIVETDAENEDEAVEMVRQRYRNCEFVLDASDYIETEISVTPCVRHPVLVYFSY